MLMTKALELFQVIFVLAFVQLRPSHTYYLGPSAEIYNSTGCMKDCSTFSEVGDATYSINCSISNTDHILFGAVCDEVNRTEDGTPSKAEHIKKDKEWYLYVENNEVKVVLNFSWRPGQDSSIRSLQKYYLTIAPFSTASSSYTECFTIHTQLNEAQHKNAEFYYDCYGVESNTKVIPDGTKYLIQIVSLPGPSQERFEIEIPQTNKPLKGEVEQIFCENRSVQYSYDVPSSYGGSATVALCEKGAYAPCNNVLQKFTGLQPKGTLYNLTISSAANLSINYSVYVEGNVSYDRAYSDVHFSECLLPTLPLPKAAIIVSSCALAVLVFGSVLCVAFLVFPNKLHCWTYKENKTDVSLITPEGIPDDIPHIPNNINIYVVFAEDDDYHVEVVHSFCRFLMADLGLKVTNHLWEQNDAAKNRIQYMMERFLNCDKVLVICSEGTKYALSDGNDWRNMHSGAIHQALMQAFGKYKDKCLLAYFDYSSVDDVPAQFPEYKRTYRLMSEMDVLFFNLTGIEQVQNGRKLHISQIDNYFDEDKCTAYAKELRESIAKKKYHTITHL